jgi:hypothetical protein
MLGVVASGVVKKFCPGAIGVFVVAGWVEYRISHAEAVTATSTRMEAINALRLILAIDASPQSRTKFQ